MVTSGTNSCPRAANPLRTWCTASSTSLPCHSLLLSGVLLPPGKQLALVPSENQFKAESERPALTSLTVAGPSRDRDAAPRS